MVFTPSIIYVLHFRMDTNITNHGNATILRNQERNSSISWGFTPSPCPLPPGGEGRVRGDTVPPQLIELISRSFTHFVN